MTRREGLALALQLGFALATVVALTSTWPPFVDIPLHAHTLAMLRDPSAFEPVHVVRGTAFDTNSLWFTLDRWVLAPFTTPSTSIRLGAACAVIGVPIGLAAWARALGRDPVAASLFGWWIAWSRPLYWGFLHFSMACGMGLLALASDADAARRPSPGRHARTAIVLVLTYLLHVQVWAFVGILLGVQRLVDGTRRGLVSLAACALPSILMAIPWAIDTFGPPDDGPRIASVTSGLGMVFDPPHINARFLVMNSAAVLKHTLSDDRLITALLWLGVGGLVLAAARGAWTRRGPDLVLLVSGALAVAVYVWGPSHLKGQFFVSMRMAWWVLPPACLLATAPVHSTPIAKGLCTALATLGAVTTLWLHTDAMARARDEVAPVMALMDQAEPPGIMTYWDDRRTSQVAFGMVHNHLPGWYAAEHGVEPQFSFASMRPNPIVYADPDGIDRSRTSEEKRPWCSAMAGRGGSIDWVVTKHHTRRKAMCGAVGHYADHLEQVAKEGPWALWRVTSPLPKAPRTVRKRCRCRGR